MRRCHRRKGAGLQVVIIEHVQHGNTPIGDCELAASEQPDVVTEK
jgi:hypothetical protein